MKSNPFGSRKKKRLGSLPTKKPNKHRLGATGFPFGSYRVKRIWAEVSAHEENELRSKCV